MLLQRFQTLPNLALACNNSDHFYHSSSYPLENKSITRYATSDGGGMGMGRSPDGGDEEMTSYVSSSPTASTSSEHDRNAITPPERESATAEVEPHLHPGLIASHSICANIDDDLGPVQFNQDGQDDGSIHITLSEWESNGGLAATQAAFEGQLLFEADLDQISRWIAPIVWKMYLRQATQCSAQHRHQYDVPLETACPSYFPKLLTRAMPRYRGGMTRAIATTHALLYLHRIKTCFHCTTVSSASSASSSSSPLNKRLKVKYTPSSSPSSDEQCIIHPSSPSHSSPREGMTKEQYQKAITNIAAQCSLFFAVGMHYASLWLLDCCPGEKTYWKRYVQCVQTSHGIAWSRLVLQHWNYQINVSIEDWLIFCSQLLAKFPYIDDEARSRMDDTSTTPLVVSAY